MSTLQKGSVWDEGVTFSQVSSPLPSRVDIAIIGAGITGITAAYLLSKAGASVAVIEKSKLGRGATGATTGFLTQSLDTDPSELLEMFGEEKTIAILQSHAQAIDHVEDIIQRERIECEFVRCSNYIYSVTAKENQALGTEYKAAQQVKIPAILQTTSTFNFSKGHLEIPNQAKFHPLKYLSSLTNIIDEQGVSLVVETEVETLEHDREVSVHTSHGVLRAQHVLVATHAPFDRALFFKKGRYTSYIVQGDMPPGSVQEGTYEDLANPYHYFRIDKGEKKDRFLLGGADHRSDIPVDSEKNFKAVEAYAQRIFSDIPYTLQRRWSGPIVEPADGLAFIGPLNERRISYATGFSGNGMTYSMIAAQIFTDHVLGNTNMWQNLYDARRIPTATQLLHKARDYAGEVVGGAIKNTVTYS